MRTKTLQSMASEDELALLKKASELSGLRLNAFTRSAAIEKAREIIRLNGETIS